MRRIMDYYEHFEASGFWVFQWRNTWGCVNDDNLFLGWIMILFFAHFVQMLYFQYFNLYTVGINITHKLGFGPVTIHNALTSFFVHFAFERWHVAASESGPGAQWSRSVLWDRFTVSRSNMAQTNPKPINTAWITTARSMSNLLPVLIMSKENFSGLQNPFWKCCQVQKQTQ